MNRKAARRLSESKTRLILAFFLIFAFTGLQATESKWRKYENARFGFVLTYPASLVGSPEPTNGDGREFHSRDHQFSITAVAHFFVPGTGDSFQARWNEEMRAAGVRITYKKKAGAWYVVSGVTKQGTEYYHKFFVKGANWARFDITYPHAAHAKYDPWVIEIERTFIPFRKGDFDRLD